ncbi:hypothetical protein GH714_005666 [Hevea brasiliensis]|uniref:Uncharacterized protein n=1 Tax=Hevea brasiliensis TaxID=3981 RepID=A0A6A6LYM7_HEVBR|nr:hypothetical protein GH714_005666 [Hevea brasiliensis]
MTSRGSAATSSRTRVGRYELGRTLGEGTFAKVKFARNSETGENVAIKILDKEKVLRHKMIGQIKREISTMKLIRHPNVIRMYEVMASKTKIYIVLEFVTGGELFDKIASRGRLKEDEARKYFQQLINAVDYCHSRGVYHRDLKPENLLLDASGVLKVSDFGLSALPQQVREDGLLHTTCGTPNYVAPEVINNKGYDGAKADLWSCGVILYVLMAGYLPFEESNLMALYKKIFKADFTCPPWFSSSAKKLIKRILDPNPLTRITIAEVIENEWFKKGYKPPTFEQAEVSLDDVNSIFNESGYCQNLVVESRGEAPIGPVAPITMNAFELISTSQGLNLSSLFEKQMMKLQGEKTGRKGHLSIATEIFEVAPSLYMVELRKSGGDTLEFHKFYKNLSAGLKDIVWRTIDEEKEEGKEDKCSAGASSPTVPANAHASKAASLSLSGVGSQLPWTSLSTSAGGFVLGSSRPSCRPWERGDLLRRLATFKPSNWFGKPKIASSLACAQRGWMNIDIDKIVCESCGECLSFVLLLSWTPAEVESAAEAFAKQLDDGHKASCPWRGNSCPEILVQFPPTPQSALIGGYKDRCDGLLQFHFLPIVAASAVKQMWVSWGPVVDRFLSQSQNFTSGEGDFKSEGIPELETSRDGNSCLYSHAQVHLSHDPGPSKKAHSASAKKDTGKNKLLAESRCDSRSPLLDCSLCGATVRILDFLTVARPARFTPNNIDIPDASKKMALTRGVSAASGISGWVAADDTEKEHTEDRDEVATTDKGKLLQNSEVDLNLTMAGGLPFALADRAAILENVRDVEMGRDLMIGQPSGSEVGDRATSYESRGPSSRKRNLEIDGRQFSAGPSKRARDSDFFDTRCSPCQRDSSGAGPSYSLGMQIYADGNIVTLFHQGSDQVVGIPSARNSTRASSVIAMDTVCHNIDGDSMESVENYPGDIDDVHFPSSSTHGNLDMNETSELNYSNQAQKSFCVRHAAEVVPGEMGVSSTNDGEGVFNAETVTAQARDGPSFGISGGSVGMCASHEAEIHRADVSVHRADSVVGDVEPRIEDLENQGQTGESVPDPGLMDEVVPDETNREDPHGDSQEMSRSVERADSGSKIDGSTKVESVESGEKASQSCKLALDKNAHPSLSCNANMYSGYQTTKKGISKAGRSTFTNNCPCIESDYAVANGIGPPKGESNYEEAIEFDPLIHHKQFCPWVNGNVAAAGCSSCGSGNNADVVALCGWQLTLDALDALRSLGQIPIQTVQSESAASLYKDDRQTSGQQLLRRHSMNRSHVQH